MTLCRVYLLHLITKWKYERKDLLETIFHIKYNITIGVVTFRIDVLLHQYNKIFTLLYTHNQREIRGNGCVSDKFDM